MQQLHLCHPHLETGFMSNNIRLLKLMPLARFHTDLHPLLNIAVQEPPLMYSSTASALDVQQRQLSLKLQIRSGLCCTTNAVMPANSCLQVR